MECKDGLREWTYFKFSDIKAGRELIKNGSQVPITKTVEKKTRQERSAPPQVSAKHFSISRSDAADTSPKNATGITIQIRLKSAASGRLVTRKNTEFWLSANNE